MEFWKIKRAEFPRLAQLARRYLKVTFGMGLTMLMLISRYWRNNSIVKAQLDLLTGCEQPRIKTF